MLWDDSERFVIPDPRKKQNLRGLVLENDWGDLGTIGQIPSVSTLCNPFVNPARTYLRGLLMGKDWD